MNTTNQNEYPLPANSYASFDAISLRNLIIQRLNDQGLFTDQNYIGSNLASIIDIVSFSFNTLIYYLNKTSTEATFTEAQLYENINRIVKLLDYKPIGYQTSTLVFEASANALFNQGNYTIPRYSYVTVGGIAFSFNEDISFKVPQAGVLTPLSDLTNRKLMYQGVYGENPLYVAAGDPNEVVPVTIASGITIDHFNVDVYVNEADTGLWFQYSNVPNLHTETSSVRSFEKRLNQNGVYEISFGDGVNGRKLNVGDRVAIYALQSSGTAGVVGPGALASPGITNVVYSTTTFDDLWKNITRAEAYTPINQNSFKNVLFNNVVGSTIPVDAESADSIRNNAPTNFKSQYRLVTQQDYQTFISTNFANFISDVKVFTNWDYTGKYLKYFNDIQVSPTTFRQIMLNQVLYSDACNFNNVYICAKPKAAQGSSLKYLLPAQKETIISNVNPLKVLSNEVMFVDPIYKAVSFGVPSVNGVVASESDFSQLEIIRNTTSRRSDGSIISEVVNVFNTFFNPSNFPIVNSFDYTTLLTNILNVDGVSTIRTNRPDTGDVYSGLSLFMWNPTFPSLDIQQVTSTPKIGEFEVVYFNNLSNIVSKIVIATS